MPPELIWCHVQNHRPVEPDLDYAAVPHKFYLVSWLRPFSRCNLMSIRVTDAYRLDRKAITAQQYHLTNTDQLPRAQSDRRGQVSPQRQDSPIVAWSLHLEPQSVTSAQVADGGLRQYEVLTGVGFPNSPVQDRDVGRR